MGYCTTYYLEVWSESGRDNLNQKDIDAIRDKFNEITGGGYEFEDVYNAYVEWKWYDHREDMIQLAKAFPKFYFTLSGEGEDRADIWIEQYHGDEFYIDMAEIIEPKRKW